MALAAFQSLATALSRLSNDLYQAAFRPAVLPTVSAEDSSSTVASSNSCFCYSFDFNPLNPPFFMPYCSAEPNTTNQKLLPDKQLPSTGDRMAGYYYDLDHMSGHRNVVPALKAYAESMRARFGAQDQDVMHVSFLADMTAEVRSTALC
jgi:hypothetical protein